MKKNDIYTLAILILLTLTTAFFSINYSNLKYIALIILGLSGIKFLSVSFQFMELKKANPFWKVMISLYLVFFIGIVLIIL